MKEDLTVIKIGTGVLTRDSDGQLDTASLVQLVTAVSKIVTKGERCLMVSSGAVGAGIKQLGLNFYPTDVATRQACAAVGQSRLMQTYSSLFQHFELQVAQILLTAEELATPKRRRRVIDTINRLIAEPHIVPIINENDSVAVEELCFGDNDMLSARVASLIKAKRLILLSTVDGLYPPEGKEIIEEVKNIKEVLSFAGEESGKFSIGGMQSKLTAVQFALDQGIETFIANGRNPQNIAKLMAGQGRGTRFLPAT